MTTQAQVVLQTIISCYKIKITQCLQEHLRQVSDILNEIPNWRMNEAWNCVSASWPGIRELRAGTSCPVDNNIML